MYSVCKKHHLVWGGGVGKQYHILYVETSSTTWIPWNIYDVAPNYFNVIQANEIYKYSNISDSIIRKKN